MSRRKKKAMTPEKRLSLRFLIFSIAIVAAFACMLYGAYRLQVINGEQYAESANASGTKTIAVKGMRGMIVDTNSVILAKSEISYDLQFQRVSDENTSNDYAEFTRSILDTN